MLTRLELRDAELKRCTWCGAWTDSGIRNPESSAPICTRCNKIHYLTDHLESRHEV